MNHDPGNDERGASSDDPRDAHLQRALRHAPDADLAPPPALSEAILRAAREALEASAGGVPIVSVAAPVTSAANLDTPSSLTSPTPATSGASRACALLRGWMELWSQLAQPRWAGAIAGLTVATLVGVMWWGQPMERAIRGAPEVSEGPAAAGATDFADETAKSRAAPSSQIPRPSRSDEAAAPPPAPAIQAKAERGAAQIAAADRPALGRVAKGATTTTTEARSPAPAPRRDADALAKHKADSADAATPAQAERQEADLSARAQATPAQEQPSAAPAAPATATAMADAGGGAVAGAGAGNVAQQQVAAAIPEAKAALSTPPGEAAASSQAALSAARRANESRLARAAAGTPGPAAPETSSSLAPAAKRPRALAPATALADLRRSIAAQPQRWSWRPGDGLSGGFGAGQRDSPQDGTPRPMSPELQDWLARLDAVSMPERSTPSAATPAALHLLRDARPHSTLHWGANSVQWVETGAPGTAWRAALPGSVMLELQAALAQLAR